MENITQIIVDEKGNEIVNRPYTTKELNEKILKPYEINVAYAAFIKQNYNLQGEQFKEYHPSKEYNQYADAIEKYLKDKNIKVEISNLGRVRINGEIEEQTDEFDYEQDDYKNGYLRLKNYPRLGRVYRLVAETWLKKDPAQEEKVFEGNSSNTWDIHHITNNGYDNRPENLIWVKRKLHYGNENTIHGK